MVHQVRQPAAANCGILKSVTIARIGVDLSSAQAYPWRQKPKNANGLAGQKPRRERVTVLALLLVAD